VCCLLVSEMEWHRVLPDEYTLPAMLNCCNYARPRNPSLAVEWFQKFAPNVHVNKHVKQALSKAVGHETAQQLIAWALTTFPSCRAPQLHANGGRGKRTNRTHMNRGGNRNKQRHHHQHQHGSHMGGVPGQDGNHKQPGSRSKKSLCTSYQRTGSCRFGESCRFTHADPADPGRPQQFYQPEPHQMMGPAGPMAGEMPLQKYPIMAPPCFEFQRQGRCRFGDACRYTHGPPV